MKTTIRDVDLRGKTVLCRVDFNVPLDDKGEITDDKRIVEALPTIKYIAKQGAKVILCSHLGRPDGKRNMKYSLLPVAKKLVEFLTNKVYFASDIIGDDAKHKVETMKHGDILLLENLRFDPGEEDCSPEFAKSLASLADFYVNDAFGTAHRKHASTYLVAKQLPNAVGFLIEKEIRNIVDILENPERPYVAVVGGAKVGDKIEMIKNLLGKVDCLLIGGGMAYTFLKAQGFEVGKSLVDETKIDTAKDILNFAKDNNRKIYLPIDSLASKSLTNAKTKVFKTESFSSDYCAYDIGPKTAKLFAKIITHSKTAIWNGPMGVFENKKFEKGTKKVAKAFAKVKGYTIVGGGDSALAIKTFGLENKISHISTGGGASLKLFEGATLPCVEAISDLKEEK